MTSAEHSLLQPGIMTLCSPSVQVMLIVYAMLIIVAACTSIVLTYLQLNSEDPRWPWFASSPCRFDRAHPLADNSRCVRAMGRAGPPSAPEP